MQNSGDGNLYKYEPSEHHHRHHNSSLKSKNRLSPYQSFKYADIGFTIAKVNKKYVAHCKICNRTLGNTAYARLKGHRNICRGSPTRSDPGINLYSRKFSDERYASQDENMFSQASNNNSRHLSKSRTNNVIMVQVKPKIEPMECQLTPKEDDQLINDEHQLKRNMVEVLLHIKCNKKLLFGKDTQKSIEMWTYILRKAQSLDLAPSDVPWFYARDSLYSLWRLHTMKKKEAIEAGDPDAKFNIVDLSILEIENKEMVREGGRHKKKDNLFRTSNHSSIGDHDHDQLNSFARHDKKENLFRTSNHSIISDRDQLNSFESNSSTISTQTEDEIYKTELRLKSLQCEALEIENYKRSLQVLGLERRLRIPHSKFTFSLIQQNENQSNEKPNLLMGDGSGDSFLYV